MTFYSSWTYMFLLINLPKFCYFINFINLRVASQKLSPFDTGSQDLMFISHFLVGHSSKSGIKEASVGYPTWSWPAVALERAASLSSCQCLPQASPGFQESLTPFCREWKRNWELKGFASLWRTPSATSHFRSLLNFDPPIPANVTPRRPHQSALNKLLSSVSYRTQYLSSCLWTQSPCGQIQGLHSMSCAILGKLPHHL